MDTAQEGKMEETQAQLFDQSKDAAPSGIEEVRGEETQNNQINHQESSTGQPTITQLSALLESLPGNLGHELTKILTPNEHERLQSLLQDGKQDKQSSSKQPKNFMELPLEVRQHVYSYMLVRPKLSEAAPLSDYRPNYSYNINTCILYVSKQIYTEASDVLYHENKFLFAIGEKAVYGANREVPMFCLSPLTRHLGRPWLQQNQPLSDRHLKIKQAPGLTRVRHWKLVMSGVLNSSQAVVSPNRYLNDLCRIICHKPPQSLEICMIPRGMDSDSASLDYHPEETFETLATARAVRFRDANLYEIPISSSWAGPSIAKARLSYQAPRYRYI